MNNANRIFNTVQRLIPSVLAFFLIATHADAATETELNDDPLFSNSQVANNVALVLSVEFPTGVGSAYTDDYNINREYLGYWDANLCYKYYGNTYAEIAANGFYFKPAMKATRKHICNAVGAMYYWSGNYLNWALTQTIDPFRQALSGGYRSIDTEKLTVLQKAYASGQENESNRPGEPSTRPPARNPTLLNNDLIAKSTPFQNTEKLAIRISDRGKKFHLSDNPDLLKQERPPDYSDAEAPRHLEHDKIYEFSPRVKACDPNFLPSYPSANTMICTRYPSGYYKPTGQIQKNAKKLHFAAFGYLMDDTPDLVESGGAVTYGSNIRRDGGVLKARMGSLGPKKAVPESTATNPNAEWDKDTGVFYPNPDPKDANASGVDNSGVINYLNEFSFPTGRYKIYDPVSELYYTAIRYFKNQDAVPSYASGLNYRLKDGYPAINYTRASTPQTGDDPIRYECASNFIVGVGDTNTRADANLPGSTINGNGTKIEPPLPPQVAADTTVNVRIATNQVGAMQNIPRYRNLGEKYIPWYDPIKGHGTFQIAGLAYDSHTVDIRPDIPGKQTIETFWLDVLQDGDRKDFDVPGMRNQYWLATKYGGFDVPDGYIAYGPNTKAPKRSTWDANNDDDPDNYFRVDNPKRMIDSLADTFSRISSKPSEGSSDVFAVVDPNLTEGDIALSTSYNSTGWVGNVTGSRVSFDASDPNTPKRDKVWEANSIVESQNWDTGRWIATANCTIASDGQRSCSGIPFRLSSITSTDSTTSANTEDLEAAGGKAQDVLNFIRGYRGLEGNPYRMRQQPLGVLGDIARSKIAVVGPPNDPMSYSYNPGYSTFKSNYASRPNMAYVGGNDGMLHAFKATLDKTGGRELFAYIPSMLFNGPNATPATDGLAALSKNRYTHHPYVDATPVVQDVNFNNNPNRRQDWHTLLVGGLGKGGRGYYALDVTDPKSLSNENTLAKAVKWEFTHKDMGYSYGDPFIVKIDSSNAVEPSERYKGWAVIVTSGYNTPDGNGYFFVLNASNGQLIKKIQTYATAPETDAGLSSPNAFINNLRISQADAAYAGDLLGNLWRLNLKDFTVTNIASFADGTDINAKPQPITVKPRLAVDKATGNRYVLVGTGRLLADTDAPNTQTQSLYAIMDGRAADGNFFTAFTLPTGVSYPITRGNLNNNSTSFKDNGVTNPTSNSVGWFMDLADKYFVNVDMRVNADIWYVAANSAVGNPCARTNNNRLFQLYFASGAAATNGTYGYSEFTGLSMQIALFRNATSDSNGPLIAGSGVSSGSTSNGNGTNNNATPAGGDGGECVGNLCTNNNGKQPSRLDFRLLNWRDLPTAD